VLKSTIW